MELVLRLVFSSSAMFPRTNRCSAISAAPVTLQLDLHKQRPLWGPAGAQILSGDPQE